MDPSLIPDPLKKKWVVDISKSLKLHFQINIEIPPVSIFQVPENITTKKPQAYVPQQIGFGPYHHFQPGPYAKMEQKKLVVVQRVLEEHEINDHGFRTLVIAKVKELVPAIRACYETFLNDDNYTIAWVYAIDGLFLLNLLQTYGRKHPKADPTIQKLLAQDIMMVENQIPFMVLKEIDKALKKLSGTNLSPTIFRSFSEIHSPLDLCSASQAPTHVEHLLHYMYHSIIKNVPTETLPLPVSSIDSSDQLVSRSGLFVAGSYFRKKRFEFGGAETLSLEGSDALSSLPMIPYPEPPSLLVSSTDSSNQPIYHSLVSEYSLQSNLPDLSCRTVGSECTPLPPTLSCSDGTISQNALPLEEPVSGTDSSALPASSTDSGTDSLVLPASNTELSDQPVSDSLPSSNISKPYSYYNVDSRNISSPDEAGYGRNTLSSNEPSSRSLHIIDLVKPLTNASDFFKKAPKKETIELYEQTITSLQNFSKNKISIPSASKLHSRAGLRFRVLPNGEGIKKINIDGNNFYLPRVTLNNDSGVILRNLVAYETLIPNSNQFPLTEYMGLMCGLVVNADDVKLLKKENIIKGDLPEDEVAKIFVEMHSSILSLKTKEKSELQNMIDEVNKVYERKPRIKVYLFLKKLVNWLLLVLRPISRFVGATWKIVAFLISMVTVFMLTYQAYCEVYGCDNKNVTLLSYASS